MKIFCLIIIIMMLGYIIIDVYKLLKAERKLNKQINDRKKQIMTQKELEDSFWKFAFISPIEISKLFITLGARPKIYVESTNMWKPSMKDFMKNFIVEPDYYYDSPKIGRIIGVRK